LANLILGQEQDSFRGGFSASEAFKGAIDEVRFYDYVLSDRQIADNAAVASYHLDGGNSAYDSSPYVNTGTLSGASWTTGLWTSKGFGYGANFDSSGEYVSVPSSTSLRITNAITIAAWIKISRKTGDSSDQLIVSKNGYDYILNVYGTNRGANVGKIEVGGNSLSPAWLVGSTVVDDNKWHYIVFTYDGSMKKIYVDGTLDAYASTSGGFASTTGALRIGCQPSGDYRQVNGIIDEVRIHDRALSQTEISNYYSANLPRHWLMTSAIWDQNPNYPLSPWFKIDGQYTTVSDVARGSSHTIQAAVSYVDPYIGTFYFDRFTYDSTTSYSNPMTIQISKDTQVVAHYTWYG
jgi:Concanavalin A-like lectin/glucanases superfamily/Pentaxin family